MKQRKVVELLKEKDKTVSLIYPVDRYDEEVSPLAIYIPSASILFKMMKCCVGVTDVSQLWIYSDKSIQPSKTSAHEVDWTETKSQDKTVNDNKDLSPWPEVGSKPRSFLNTPNTSHHRTRKVKRQPTPQKTAKYVQVKELFTNFKFFNQ